VAIAHVVWHFSDQHPVPTPDGTKPGPTDDLATLVYVKQNGKWLMMQEKMSILIKEHNHLIL